MSVNCTVCPSEGNDGLNVNDAISVEAGATLMIWVEVLDPELLTTVRATAWDPAAVKVWLGFRIVLVVPSLKFHCQDVGLPIDVSVNCIAWPATGEAGL